MIDERSRGDDRLTHLLADKGYDFVANVAGGDNVFVLRDRVLGRVRPALFPDSGDFGYTPEEQDREMTRRPDEASAAAPNAGAAAANPKRILTRDESHLEGVTADVDATRHQKKRTKAVGEQGQDATPTDVEMEKPKEEDDGAATIGDDVSSSSDHENVVMHSEEPGKTDAGEAAGKEVSQVEASLRRIRARGAVPGIIVTTAEEITVIIKICSVQRLDVTTQAATLITSNMRKEAATRGFVIEDLLPEVQELAVATLRLVNHLEEAERNGHLTVPERTLREGYDSGEEISRIAAEARQDDDRSKIHARCWGGFVKTSTDLKIPDPVKRQVFSAALMVDQWMQSARRKSIGVEGVTTEDVIEEIATNIVAAGFWPSWSRYYLESAVRMLHVYSGEGRFVDISVCLTTLYGVGFGIETGAVEGPKGNVLHEQDEWWQIVLCNMYGDPDSYVAYEGLFFDTEQLPSALQPESQLMPYKGGKGKGKGVLDFPDGGVAAKGTRVLKRVLEAEGCRFPISKALEDCLCENGSGKCVLPKGAHILEVDGQSKFMTFFSVVQQEGAKDWDAVMEAGGDTGAIIASGRNEAVRLELEVGSFVAGALQWGYKKNGKPALRVLEKHLRMIDDPAKFIMHPETEIAPQPEDGEDRTKEDDKEEGSNGGKKEEGDAAWKKGLEGLRKQFEGLQASVDMKIGESEARTAKKAEEQKAELLAKVDEHTGKLSTKIENNHAAMHGLLQNLENTTDRKMQENQQQQKLWNDNTLTRLQGIEDKAAGYAADISRKLDQLINNSKQEHQAAQQAPPPLQTYAPLAEDERDEIEEQFEVFEEWLRVEEMQKKGVDTGADHGRGRALTAAETAGVARATIEAIREWGATHGGIIHREKEPENEAVPTRTFGGAASKAPEIGGDGGRTAAAAGSLDKGGKRDDGDGEEEGGNAGDAAGNGRRDGEPDPFGLPSAAVVEPAPGHAQKTMITINMRGSQPHGPRVDWVKRVAKHRGAAAVLLTEFATPRRPAGYRRQWGDQQQEFGKEDGPIRRRPREARTDDCGTDIGVGIMILDPELREQFERRTRSDPEAGRHVNDLAAAVRSRKRVIAVYLDEVVLVSAYAPHDAYSRAEQDAFDTSFVKVMREIKRRKSEKWKMRVVAGDWNCQIGRDEFGESPIHVGDAGAGETNARGRRFARVLMGSNLVMVNSKFPQQDGEYATQDRGHELDFFITTGPCLQKFRSYLRFDMNAPGRVREPGVEAPGRFDHLAIESLVDVKTKRRLKQEGEVRKLATMEILDNIGDELRARFNADLQERIARQGDLFRLEEFRDYLIEYLPEMMDKRRMRSKQNVPDAEKLAENATCRANMWRLFRDMRANEVAAGGAGGKSEVTPEEAKAKYDEVGNTPLQPDGEELEIDKELSNLVPKLSPGAIEELDKPITAAELRTAVMRLRSGGRARDVHGLGPDMLMHFDDRSLALLTGVLVKQLAERDISELEDRMHLCRDVPLYKGKGCRRDAGNYRFLAVSPTLLKLIVKIMNDRLCLALEAAGYFSATQYGFRKGRGCVDSLALENVSKRVQGDVVGIVTRNLGVNTDPDEDVRLK
eukprot:g18747.t1